MRRKSQRQPTFHHDYKQNISQNNQHPHQLPKSKPIKKTNNYNNILHPLQQNYSHKNTQQLHNLCLQQQKLILAEYRQNRMLFHQQFYQFVRQQLTGSKICNKIMLIKNMTNQQAIQQYQRIQQYKNKYGNDILIIADNTHNILKQQDNNLIEEKIMFDGCGKKMSMIQANDDVYLKELDGDRFIRSQEQGQGLVQTIQNIEDQCQDMEKQIQSKTIRYQNYYQCQYYQNDDIFEL